MRMRKNTAVFAGAVFAGIVALAAVAVAFTLVARQSPPAPDAAADLPMRAAFPPAAAVDVEPPAVEREPASVVVEHSPALCDGCLTERAVLDVVETYLRHLDPVYLQGERWAQPFAEVDTDKPQPNLPPGLEGAPESNPFGTHVFSYYPVETTWLVWLQTGWVPHKSIEQLIRTVRETTLGEIRARGIPETETARVEAALEAAGMGLSNDLPLQTIHGELPEVALSWPPIKKETYVAVDSRTGKIWPDGIFELTSAGQRPAHPPHYEEVLEATRERVARWLQGGGSELGTVTEPTQGQRE